MDTNLEHLFSIPQNELYNYKLHLAVHDRNDEPLNVFARNWDEWVGWNQWRGGKGINRFSRPYIFSLIRYYHEPDRWMFGGIFKITNRLNNWNLTGIGYEVELDDNCKDLIGKLVVAFSNENRQMCPNLENVIDKISLSEILKIRYDGTRFPGLDSVSLNFTELEHLVKYQKSDWRQALEQIKGVYVIVDKSNGKKYIGSAYGEGGIWKRWSDYVNTGGHGSNKLLAELITTGTVQHAREHFQFTLLEYRPMRTDDSVIIQRESF